jgi:hypothetical protein
MTGLTDADRCRGAALPGRSSWVGDEHDAVDGRERALALLVGVAEWIVVGAW